MKTFAFLFAFLALASCQPAFAEGCTQTPAAAFVTDGVAAIEAGTVKGIAIQGDDAVLFAKNVGMPDNVKVFAIFFLAKDDGDLVMFVVFASAEGNEGVCYGEPGDNAKEELRAYIDRRSAANG